MTDTRKGGPKPDVKKATGINRDSAASAVDQRSDVDQAEPRAMSEVPAYGAEDYCGAWGCLCGVLPRSEPSDEFKEMSADETFLRSVKPKKTIRTPEAAKQLFGRRGAEE